MSTTIDLSRPLAIPGPLALDAMLRILRAVDDGVPPYDAVALSLGLAAVRFGVVSIPVAVASSAKPSSYECEIVIAAERFPTAFPRFKGTVSISPLRETGSELWLQGEYVAPFGAAGEAVDATVLHGVARQSLDRFVGWLADEITARASGPSADRQA